MNYLLPLLLILATLGACSSDKSETANSKNAEYDIVVYGGTSAGVIAAVTAKRMGKSVLLVSTEKHLGGLSSGGLGATDVGNKKAFTGLALDYYRRIGSYYDQLEAWRFEPHIAEQVFMDYIAEEKIPVLYFHRVIDGEKKGNKLLSITVEAFGDSAGAGNKTLNAKQFIDCTYEGDLLPIAGVSYTVGREGNAEYGEVANGVQVHKQHQFPDSLVSPYVVPGDPQSGLLWGVSDAPLRSEGTGDSLVQAYNFRLCLTKDPENKREFYKPDNYNKEWYQLLARWVKNNEARYPKEWETLHWNYFRIVEMPKGKTDFNNKGAVSTDMIGYSWEYPEAGYQKRAEIKQMHEDYIKGLLYFMANDTAIEAGVRSEMAAWGYAKDEFTDNNNFPYALYVREGRRMLGEMVMTEHHVLRKEPVKDTIAFGAYQMDSHNCERLVVNGYCKNEGDVQNKVAAPYPISYQIMVPKEEECTNLTVPVAVSASHIAFGSIRMEPVFMALAQAAAMGSCMAIEKEKAVQSIDGNLIYAQIQKDPYLDGKPKNIVVDDEDLESKPKAWQTPAGRIHHAEWNLYGSTYIFDSTGTQKLSISLPQTKKGQSYTAYYFCSNLEADTAYVSLRIGGAEKQLLSSENPSNWSEIGTFTATGEDFLEISGNGKQKAWFDAVLLKFTE